MIKQSYEATLARSITSRRQNTGAPSMTVKAVKDRKLPTSRTRKNRNPDDAHKQSTGNGEQADNGRSTEVPFGGSCKSASPEVQIPVVHTTYASLAKERAARKTEYEEKMLNFRQSLTNSRLKQSRPTQGERQSIGKSYSVQYKTKPRKKSVVVLGLQRQTNGDLFVASLSAKTEASILEKRLVGSQGYLLSAKNNNSVYNVSSIETSNMSNDLAEHTQGNAVAKYNSSHYKPSANITSNTKTDGIDLCKENSQGNFGLESRSKQQNQTDVVGSRLTPKDSKINADIADTVQVRNSYRDKENGARAQKLIETLDKVKKESRYEDLDLAVSHHNIGTRFNPLNRNLETAGLENLLHELETTLESLQQGRSPKGLELSSHLEVLRKSSRVTAPSVHSIRSRAGARESITKNEINKRQAGSPNPLPFPEKSNKTQPVASSSQGSRRPHLKKSTPSKQGFRADDDTKYLDENHDSLEGLQRRILLAKFNRKPPREETADKVSAIVSPITGAVSEPPSLGQSETSVDSPMGTGHSKTAPPGDSNQVRKRHTPISVDTKNKRIVVNSKDTRMESEKNTLNSNSTRTGNTNLDVEDASNLTTSVKNRLDSKNDLISRNSETKDSSKKNPDKASGSSHLQTANHKSLKSGVKLNANWQVSESLAPIYVNGHGEQETGKDNLDKETKLREKETSLDVLDNSVKDNDKDVSSTRNNEEPESQKAEPGGGEKAEDNSGNKSSFPYTQGKSRNNNPTPSNETSLDFNEDQQIETSENSTSNEINFHHTQGISTEHNGVHVETPAESNGFQQNETLQVLKSRENTTAEPARTASDIDIAKAAAQKRDEQRKISAAISRGGTTGGMGSTSVPSLLSQPLSQPQQQQQQQQQHQQQQLPLLQPEQPQFPGVVPASSVNGNTHTGNPQIVNGNIHYSGQSNHRTHPLNSENNTALPAVRDGSLYNQVSTQLFSHGVDVDTPRYDSESPTNRKRREGRDHTNWAPPPNFRGLLRESLDLGTMPGENAVVSTTNSNYYNNNNHRDIAKGGFVSGDGTGEEGLQLIVLDKTDDEDDETIHPPFGNLDTGRYATNRSDSGVFPADKRAVERDLFQQEYSPTLAKPELYNNARKISRNGFVSLNNNLAARTGGPQTLKGRQLTVHGDNFRQVQESYLASDTNRSRSVNDGILGLNLPQESIDTHNNVPSTVRFDAFSIDSNRTVDLVQAGTHHTQSHFEQTQGQGQVHGHGHVPPFIYNVTDFDSQQTTERSTYRNPDVASSNISTHNPFQILQSKQMTLSHQSNPTAPPHPSTSQLHPSSHSHTRQPEVTSKVQQRHQRVPPAPPPPVFAISQVDYERFTSVPPGISTVREDICRGDTSRRLKVPDDRTFVLHPDLGTMVPGPGYKFLVDRQFIQKRASRANVLTRAERLLNARRGHLTDRSDSSDDMTRKAADDDDDEDELTDMEGLRHKALRHVNRRQRKVYEDSASSDDVLHTIRYKTRGPLTVAARRARLTSFNARVNKEKRVRAARRQNYPPRGHSDDDDLNSSESEALDAYTQPWPDDDERYEESNLQDISNGNRHRQATTGGLNQQATKETYLGKRVWFFRNGDIHYKPKQILINSRIYQSVEQLVVSLSEIVETSTGVKYIFSWPEGKEIKSLTEFQSGKYYVCSSTRQLQRVDYGNSKEGHWKSGKIDRNENFLFQKNGKIQSPLRRPRVLTIISNMYRDSREKLILNTNSQMNFEDILTDIVNMVNIPNPPVRALYTERRPHQKVQSYSQLIRDFADHDNFLACGEEMVPLEMANGNSNSNNSNSNNKRGGYGMADSVDGSSRPGGKRNTRSDMSQDRDLSPGRSSDYNAVRGQGHSKARRRKTDSVRVDINGKTREFFPSTTIDEEDDGTKPDKKLRLDWVYGFRGRDVKQNLVVLPSSGELVYFVAAVVVLYDRKFASQKHYLGHSEEVTCLAVHPNGRFVATGQNAGKTPDTGAHVRVWDGVSLSTYAVVGLGSLQVGVTCINFSERDAQGSDGNELASGDLLMAIDDSDRHLLTVWEWQTEKMVARTTTTTDPVVSGCFYPVDESILVTYGREHVHFWRLFWDKGRKVMRDRLSGNFEDDVPKFVTSLCFAPNGDVITGDSTGAILIWSRDNSSVFAINEDLSLQTRRAHKKSVSALCMLGDGTLLSGGGNEVKAWDSISNYCLVKERVLPESAGHVRSLVPMSAGGLDGSIFVSTTRNKVLEGSLQLKFKVIIQSHVEELWAVESHPLEQTFVSAGHDQTVVKWSAVSHAPVWRVNVENPCTSISIDPKGRLIALGTTAGKVVILNSYNGIQLTTLLVGGAQVNALSFSPDGRQLAVGTFDGVIQIHYLTDEGQRFFSSEVTTLKHNNMFIMHMDWSVDCKFLQTCLGDYDVIFWDLNTLQKVKANRSMRDVKWATHNCPIGHSVIGPWQNLDRGEVINVVSRSQYRDLTLVGDSRGRARLYRWPCSQLKSGFHNTKVYSSNVTCATFTNDDSYVITSGGNDAALMQFSVLDPMNI